MALEAKNTFFHSQRRKSTKSYLTYRRTFNTLVIVAMADNKTLSSKFIEALSAEKKEDYEQTHQLLSTTPPKVLTQNGLAILNLVIENIRTSLGGKIILELVPDPSISGKGDNINNPLANNDFKSGDIVKLDPYPPSNLKKLQNSSNEKDQWESIENSTTIEGVVTSSNNMRINIVLANSDTQEYINERAWKLQTSNTRLWLVKVSNEATYRRMESTLRKLSEYSLDGIADGMYAPDIVQYLLGRISYSVPTDIPASLELVNKGLNKSQVDAIAFSLVSQISIIHGPPGTGKTSTLVEYVLQHLQMYPNKRILITAPSNIAVDTIVERLSPHLSTKLIRVGHPARMLSDIRKHSLDYVVELTTGEELTGIEKDIAKLEIEVRKPRTSKVYIDRKSMWAEIKDLKREFRIRSKKSVREVLIGSKVVVSTLHGSGSWELTSNIYGFVGEKTPQGGTGFFDTVIIDEVSQAMEPSCWIPIVNHAPSRLVLAGDNKQLPPTIHLTDGKDFRVLSNSLFDRIVKVYGGDEFKIPFVKFLNIQYRMCEKCMVFPSWEWYHGELKAADSVKDKKVVDLLREYTAEPKEIVKGKPKGRTKDKSKRIRKSNKASVELVTKKIEVLEVDEADPDLIEQYIWYDTQGGTCSESIDDSTIGSGSKYNIGECYIVQEHIKKLIRLGVRERDIGVIAPYSAQVSRLRSLIRNGSLEDEYGEDTEDGHDVYPDVEISTVDGFQGREKEIIILSLVRSNFEINKAEVGFLSDFRRLNVSITRCKKQLVIVGDMETMERCGVQMLQDWCEWCTEHADIRYIE